MSTDQACVEQLAQVVLGWRPAPDRYLTKERSWIPKWRFRPFTQIEDAFRLLGAADCVYSLHCGEDGTLLAIVRIGAGEGQASGHAVARVLSTAVARAIGITVGPDGPPTAQAVITARTGRNTRGL